MPIAEPSRLQFDGYCIVRSTGCKPEIEKVHATAARLKKELPSGEALFMLRLREPIPAALLASSVRAQRLER
jgi:hypothetical protein